VDALDAVLVIVVLAAAIRGFRRGAAMQVLLYGGAVAGLAAGVMLALAVCPHVHGQGTKAAVTLLLLLGPSVVLAGVGRQLGSRVWRKLRQARFGAVDAAAGALVAMAGALVVVWFLSSVLVNSQLSLVASQISESRIVQAAADVMPPIPTATAPVERFLSDEGLQLVADGLVQLSGPVSYPSAEQVHEAIRAAAGSTLKVVAVGCGDIQEGSGFVVGHDLVVTNAHVIAGTGSIKVEDALGYHSAAVVLFDPKFDLAVLRVRGLSERALRIDPDLVGRGTTAVVIGYPEGGPLQYDQAGVRSEFLATGLDIYGQSPTVRAVYMVQGLVRPGNSGGPLVEPDGLVIGVVFSHSATSNNIGYALASPGVLSRVEKAEALFGSRVVGTGGCISK